MLERSPLESFRPPVTLTGRHLALVPLDPSHAAGLARAARDPAVGEFLIEPPGTTEAELAERIATLLARQAEGRDLAFCQLHLPTGEPVGMTRFLQIDRADRKVEIGGSWLDPRWWRTPLNTESKYLLLRHAFETERFHRVSLQTDLKNERSQRAIARLGAVREGVLREDRLTSTGRFRTSVVFGLVAGDWPRVKARLEARLARPWKDLARPGGPGPRVG